MHARTAAHPGDGSCSFSCRSMCLCSKQAHQRLVAMTRVDLLEAARQPAGRCGWRGRDSRRWASARTQRTADLLCVRPKALRHSAVDLASARSLHLPCFPATLQHFNSERNIPSSTRRGSRSACWTYQLPARCWLPLGQANHAGAATASSRPGLSRAACLQCNVQRLPDSNDDVRVLGPAVGHQPVRAKRSSAADPAAQLLAPTDHYRHEGALPHLLLCEGVQR